MGQWCKGRRLIVPCSLRSRDIYSTRVRLPSLPWEGDPQPPSFSLAPCWAPQQNNKQQTTKNELLKTNTQKIKSRLNHVNNMFASLRILIT